MLLRSFISSHLYNIYSSVFAQAVPKLASLSNVISNTAVTIFSMIGCYVTVKRIVGWSVNPRSVLIIWQKSQPINIIMWSRDKTDKNHYKNHWDTNNYNSSWFQYCHRNICNMMQQFPIIHWHVWREFISNWNSATINAIVRKITKQTTDVTSFWYFIYAVRLHCVV